MNKIDEGLEGIGIQRLVDAIGIDVWLLDAEGRIVLMNDRARHTLGKATMLSVSGERLVAARPSQERALRRALAEARNGFRSMVHLGCSDHGHVFAVVPLHEDFRAASPSPVLLLGGQRTSSDPAAMTLLAKALGLTRCECEVLACLCEGLLGPQIAARRSVKLSTVRTQIARLREKLGARSVQELIAKVSTLPPMSSRLLGAAGHDRGPSAAQPRCAAVLLRPAARARGMHAGMS